MGNTIIGNRVRRFEILDSTNLLLKVEAEEGLAIDGDVIVADHQTSGRGRFDRQWDAPPGKGLLFSTLLFPGISPDRVQLISLLAAISVLSGIRNYLHRLKLDHLAGALSLKWPNDVLCNGDKLCGVLCETGHSPVGGFFVVVGVGLNVNQEKSDFAVKLRRPATSLRLMTGSTVSREYILQVILSELETDYLRLKQFGSGWIAKTWLAKAEIASRNVTVSDSGTKVSGVCLGLTEDGAILLRTARGQLKTIYSGDVD